MTGIQKAVDSESAWGFSARGFQLGQGTVALAPLIPSVLAGPCLPAPRLVDTGATSASSPSFHLVRTALVEAQESICSSA